MSGEEKGEFVFAWRIKNYSACFQTKGEFVESPGFTVENLCRSRWHLKFYPKGISKLEENGYVSFYLKWEQSGEEVKTPIDFSLEIVVRSDIVLKCKKCTHMFTKEEPIWGWRLYMDIAELAKEMKVWQEDVLTLRCRINCDKIKKQILFGSEASTIIDVNRRFFKWNVKAPLEHSRSLVFPISDGYSFEISLTSLWEGLKILVLLKEHDEILNQPMMCKMTFYNKDGRKIISKHAKHLFQDTEEWEFPDFISRSILESCKSNSSNYEFKLECEIYVSKKQILFSGIEKLHFNSLESTAVESEPIDLNVTDLQKDFRNLFLNKKYSDVSVRIGNEEFPAHKLVLRVRSPVFEAMFDQNMLESETGVVNVTDIDGETMKTFLEFLYTETVEELDYESAKKLLLAADKYQVPSLVKECVSFLISVLSVENACEIISVADSVNCECLKSRALDFIVSNAAEIMITPDWRPWIRENIDMATDILSKMSVDFITKAK